MHVSNVSACIIPPTFPGRSSYCFQALHFSDAPCSQGKRWTKDPVSSVVFLSCEVVRTGGFCVAE